jgi:hypothetical protein
MSGEWLEFVDKHLGALNRSATDASRALVALFVLDLEFDNGGLSQYLTNSSGDTWADLRVAFELGRSEPGLRWMRDVERVYGGSIPTDRNARNDRIVTLPGWSEGDDPFDGPAQMLRGELAPEVQRIGEQLVAAVMPKLPREPENAVQAMSRSRLRKPAASI